MKSESPSERLRLEDELEKHAKRTLVPKGTGLDFATNDYLGITSLESVKTKVIEAVKASPTPITGSSASRLLGGDTKVVRELESFLSSFHLGDDSLVFPSGYQTNVTLFSSLPTRHDTVFFDSLIHASIRDGIRLSNADSYSFRHNDLDDLRKKIRLNGKGRVFVAVEALYSMDGDFAPLRELAKVSNEFGCTVIVDEAHSNGIFGEKGEGIIASAPGLSSLFPIRVYTFGKAIGAQGGGVVGSSLVKEFLVSRGRGFIYSTGIAPIMALTIRVCYEAVMSASKERESLFKNVNFFRSMALEADLPLIGENDSPIQGVLLKDPKSAASITHTLSNKGLFVRHVLPPTVEEGKERLRIVLHSDHQEEGILKLVNALREVL